MTRLLDRYVLFFPMRVVLTTFLATLIVLHARHLGRWNAYHAVLIAYLLVHPHVVRLVVRRNLHDRKRIESIAFLVDGFLLGVVVYLSSFSLLPSLVLVTVGLASALAVEGFRGMVAVAGTLSLGVLIPMAFLGRNFDPQNAFGVNVVCSIFLLVYFIGFAYSAHNRSALLEQSQQELREGKATLEIEKIRADRLRLNLVPAGLAADFQRDGRIEPTVFPRVALLLVSFRAFASLLDADPREALSFLTHCFQAIDAIAARHGLEKVKSMGDLYVAVAGLPRAAAGDSANAIRAALEIRDFLADVSVRRRAADLAMPDPRIAVHTGSVVGALVESEKLAYDVWGATVPALFRLHLEAGPGYVLVSEAARRCADSEFTWEPVSATTPDSCWKAERSAAAAAV